MNILHILLDGVFITNYQNKDNPFNDFFVQQCSVLRNDSALPNMEYKTVVRNTLHNALQYTGGYHEYSEGIR